MSCANTFTEAQKKKKASDSHKVFPCILRNVYSLYAQDRRSSWHEDDGHRSPLSRLNHLGVQCAGHSAIPILNTNCSGPYKLAIATPQNHNTFDKASLKRIYTCTCTRTYTHTRTHGTPHQKISKHLSGDRGCYATHKYSPIHSAGDC